MHRLLKRQIDRFCGDGNALPDSMRPLIEAISQAYEQSDVDRSMLERSLEIVSDEMGEQNRLLLAELHERREAEQHLEKSLSTFVATLNSTTDGILVVGEDRKIESYNDRYLEMWRTSPAALKAGDDRMLVDSAARQLLNPFKFLSDGERISKSDDKSFDLLEFIDGRVFERYSQPRRIDGRIAGRVWCFRDITERHRDETELRIAAAAFQSHESMVITDANGIILRVNRAFTECTGYSMEECVGNTPRMFKSGRQDDDFYREMWKRLLADGKWEGEVWDRRKNGEIFPKWMIVSAVTGENGAITHFIATHLDITERKKSEQRIESLAFFDQLTGLLNRSLLTDRIQQALVTSARKRSCGALMLLDLDNFKALNDTLGHDIGDRFLVEISRRLRECVRASDSVARQGGDEFVVLLEEFSAGSSALAQVESVARKILAAVERPFDLKLMSDGLEQNHSYHGAVSIGITLFWGDSIGVDELLKQADLAMYRAKNSGRNTLCFFSPEMQSEVTRKAQIEARLRHAILARQFCLYYQPQVGDDGSIAGVEALIRWHDPERGMIPPDQFIPVAEECGLIDPIGRWVLETACRQLALWARSRKTAHLTMAVNVSASQFRCPDFVAQVETSISQSGADPARLKLELTESMLLDDVEDIIAKMNALKDIGVGFSLDDFGTGYSSLSYLKRLPLDQLKIDRSFVRDVLIDANDASIAGTIVALAKALGLEVIAEGVETAGQRDFLSALGCHAHQGYLYSPPLPIEQLEAYLETSSRCAARIIPFSALNK
jgi:diguanylate cyclase (GGDEF)-like protein/PAS domain S-box-containing protein